MFTFRLNLVSIFLDFVLPIIMFEFRFGYFVSIGYIFSFI